MRGDNRRNSAVLMGVWIAVVFAGCGGQDRADATPNSYVLGVAVPEDTSAGAILVTAHPRSGGSVLTDSGLAHFGIHIPVTDSLIKRPGLKPVVHWEFSDTALSADREADTRLVEIALRSEWGADMVELQLPEGARIVTVNGVDAQQPENATAEIWRSRVGGVRDTVTVELPTRCEAMSVVIAQHVLRPFEVGVLTDPAEFDRVGLDSHFRLMTSRKEKLGRLPPCCRGT